MYKIRNFLIKKRKDQIYKYINKKIYINISSKIINTCISFFTFFTFSFHHHHSAWYLNFINLFTKIELNYLHCINSSVKISKNFN
jgi:hypothetical protein